MNSQLAILAAANNADWYKMMFDIHKLKYRVSSIAFTAIDPPPPLHSWMTTLDPNAKTELEQLIKQHPGGGVVKDAFNCLDLSGHNYIKLFSANWICAHDVPDADTSDWTRVSTPHDLLLWEAAWKPHKFPEGVRQFPDAVLKRSDIVIWGRNKTLGFDAGVIANVSENCVGLSNYFGHAAYPAAAALCSRVCSLPVTGYERGEELTAALNVGFAEVGKLKLWSKPAAVT